jgi:hypothetical protein
LPRPGRARRTHAPLSFPVGGSVVVPGRSGGRAAGPPAADSVDRLADLIADGRVSFPPDWSGQDRDRLASAVRARLADRLVGRVAQAIAADLAAARDSHGG